MRRKTCLIGLIVLLLMLIVQPVLAADVLKVDSDNYSYYTVYSDTMEGAYYSFNSTSSSVNYITMVKTVTPPNRAPWFNRQGTFYVTSIAPNAAKNRTNLYGFTISDYVESIGKYAFYGCTNLGSITFPSWMKDVGEYAFASSGIYGVSIKGDLKTIGDSAFYNCANLSSFSMPDTVQSMGTYAFAGCRSLTSVQISSGLNRIASWAFSGTGLRSVVIPSSVQWIDEAAFRNCSSLTSVTLKEGLSSIGSNAFSNTGLTSVIIPRSVQSIAVNAFPSGTTYRVYLGTYAEQFCKDNNLPYEYHSDFQYRVISEEEKTCEITGCTGSLINMEIPETMDGYTVTALSGQLFRNMTFIKTITLPDTIKTIGSRAFENCSSLTSIVLPDSLEAISSAMFSGCIALKSVEMNEGLKSIEEKAFYNCMSLTSVSMPDSVTSLGNEAFGECESLWSAKLSNGLTEIPDYAFRNCNKLRSIDIPEGVVSVGRYAFYYCKELSSLTLPSTLERIGEEAFAYCIDPSVTLPQGLTEMGEWAFYGAKITELVLPDTLSGIGEYTFAFTNIKTLTIPGSIKNIASRAFYSCTALETVFVEEGVERIDYGFPGCTALKQVELPESLVIEAYDSPFPSDSKAVFTVPYGSNAYAYVTEKGFSYLFKPFTPESIDCGTDFQLHFGKSRQLPLTLTPAGLDAQKYAQPQFIYTSSDSSVATVSETGRIRALKKGETIIYVKDKDDPFVNDSVKVTVVDWTKAELTAYASASMGGSVTGSYGVRGGKAPYTVRLVISGDGSKVETHTDVVQEGENLFSFSVSAPSQTALRYSIYVSVTDADGNTDSANVTCERVKKSRQVGVGTPTYKYVNGVYVVTYPSYRTEYYYEDVVTNDRPLIEKIESITVADSEIQMTPGTQQALEYTVKGGNKNSIIFLSSNPDVIDVSEDGMISAKAVGQAMITVHAIDGSGRKASSRIICANKFVQQMKIDGGEINRETLTQQLSAYFRPQDADFQTVEWTANNPEIATIDENGVVTWLTAGEASFTARATDGSGVTAQYSYNWPGILVEEITLFVRPNGQQLGWRIKPENATNPNIIFQVIDPTMISVDAAGYMRFYSEGTTYVRAKAQDSGGVTATIEVSGSPVHAHIPGVLDISIREAENGSNGFLPEQMCVVCGEVCVDSQAIRSDRSIELPPSLKMVDDEAFYGNTALQQICLPDGMQRIGTRAFAGCTNLLAVCIPASVTDIAEDAFENTSSVVIICEKDSAAHRFAVAKEMLRDAR